MTIWMIWAIAPEADDILTLVDGWDDDTVSDNPSGWKDAIREAGATHGAGNIRIAKTDVDLDAIRQSFMPVSA